MGATDKLLPYVEWSEEVVEGAGAECVEHAGQEEVGEVNDGKEHAQLQDKEMDILYTT